MATYKKHCIHCGELIPGDAVACPFCGSADPFSLRCSKCRNPIEKGWKVCSGCGIRLTAVCPDCGQETPTAPACTHCGAPVLVQCPRKKCLEVQIRTKEGVCISCGKPIKNRR